MPTRVRRHVRRRAPEPTMRAPREFMTHPAEARKRAELLTLDKTLRTIHAVSFSMKDREIIDAHILAILLSMSAREDWLPFLDAAMADERLTDADKRLVRLAVLEMQENDTVFT